jgi:hypothetical protein
MQPAVPIGVRWTRRKTALREWSGPSSHDSYPLNDNWRHHWRSTTLVSLPIATVGVSVAQRRCVLGSPTEGGHHSWSLSASLPAAKDAKPTTERL